MRAPAFLLAVGAILPVVASLRHPQHAACRAAQSRSRLRVRMGSGFGAGGGGGVGKAKSGRAALDKEARSILDASDGNLDRAHALLFNERIQQLKTTSPATFEAMKAASSRAGGSEAGLDSEVHDKLVELTWDTVATYLPMADGKATGLVKRKLQSIAAACSRGGGGRRILDVGCGDGAILPFLDKEDGGALEYLGIDLSPRMLDAARLKHVKKAKKKGARDFELGSFMTHERCSAGADFDCVLFNGSFQFFPDAAATLERAKAALAAGGRIVLAHANGAAFVRQEHRDSPNVVVRDMPTSEELERLAADLGMRVLDPAGMGCEDLLSMNPDDFYLVGLEPAEG